MNNIEARHKSILIILLGLNLILNLLLFYNTTSFFVSEAGSNYDFLKAIENGEKPALFESSYRSILAYIGYFFKAVTGTLDAFFWFQGLLATLSVYILYLICLKVTDKKITALFSVLLATILLDYHLLTPVFYYQIFEIFFVLLVIYLVLLMIEKKKIMKSIGVLIAPVVIYFSVYFRSMLLYFWLLLIIMSIFVILKKEYQLFWRLAATGAITLILFTILPHSNYRNMDRPPVNDFIFFGHTLYGGDGGEGAFIYEENQVRYKEKLEEFMIKHNYDLLTNRIRNEFQRNEIKEFISKTPHKWLWLQVRKVAYTFGIVPVRDSLKLLTTGKLHLKWYLSAFIIQVPYAIILLIFVVLIVLFFKVTDINNIKLLFMFSVLFYLIAGTCLYGHYQERYRHVVILAGILPISAFYFSKFIDWFSQRSIKRGRFILLILILFIILSHWSYQVYDALVLNKERFINAANHF